LTASFQRQARLEKGMAINELCRELKENSKIRRSRDLFKTLKRITGEFTSRTGHVKSKSGESLTESADMKEYWREYTETLYQRNANVTQVFNEQSYTIESVVLQSEVKKAMRELSCGKSPCGDDIPIELIKTAKRRGLLQ